MSSHSSHLRTAMLEPEHDEPRYGAVDCTLPIPEPKPPKTLKCTQKRKVRAAHLLREEGLASQQCGLVAVVRDVAGPVVRQENVQRLLHL